MTDAVALSSVLSSGVVAIGGLWVSYRSGRDQRKHERKLAYEERAWEKKSDCLFGAMDTARSLIDTIESRDPVGRERLAEVVARSRERFDDLVPLVEAYTSAPCREAFFDLRQTLGTAHVDLMLDYRLTKAREEKEAAIDASHFEEAASARDRERTAQRESTEGLGLDLDIVSVQARRLIDTARSNVQGHD